MSYLTDGVHLYEILDRCRNFGLAGGSWITVRDCVTDAVRALGSLELDLCEPVLPGLRDLPTIERTDST